MDNCAFSSSISRRLSQIPRQGAQRSGGLPWKHLKLPLTIGLGFYSLPRTCLLSMISFHLRCKVNIVSSVLQMRRLSQAL